MQRGPKPGSKQRNVSDDRLVRARLRHIAQHGKSEIAQVGACKELNRMNEGAPAVLNAMPDLEIARWESWVNSKPDIINVMPEPLPPSEPAQPVAGQAMRLSKLGQWVKEP
jgi:hypothetical protein